MEVPTNWLVRYLNRSNFQLHPIGLAQSIWEPVVIVGLRVFNREVTLDINGIGTRRSSTIPVHLGFFVDRTVDMFPWSKVAIAATRRT